MNPTRGHAVIVSQDGRPDAGGVERFCQMLRVIIEDAGWTAEVLAPHPPPRWSARTGTGHLWSGRQVTRSLRGRAPDLVVTNGWAGAWPHQGRRRVHVYHGTVVDHALAIRGLTPRREWLVRGVVAGWLAEVVAGSRAQRIAVSDATAAEVKRRYRTRVHRVIPNGVDTTMFRPGDKLQARRRWGLDQDRPYALYVGRMEARKAPHVAAQACGIAGWPLVVAGRGSPPAGALHVGSLAPADLAELYRAVDAVVMPTLYEGCSLVILEALASGVPVVTTPVGWVPTLLAAAPRYAGLIGPAEPGDLARRLRSLETSGLEDAVARARAFVTRECSLDVFTERWRQALGLGADVVTSRTP